MMTEEIWALPRHGDWREYKYGLRAYVAGLNVDLDDYPVRYDGVVGCAYHGTLSRAIRSEIHMAILALEGPEAVKHYVETRQYDER